MCATDALALSWAALDACRAGEESLSSPEVPDPTADFLCAHCGGLKSFDVHDDLPVCTVCARVDDVFISTEAEWRSGADDGNGGGDPSRIGAPVNLDHFSEAWGATTFMTAQRGATYAQKRLARINMHASMNHKDRALFHAYAGMDRIGKDVLKLQDVVMYAAKIKYKAFNEAVLTRGAVRNGIKANCVFQACREHGVARTTREIADAFGIPPRDISRTFDMFQDQVPETEVHVTTPADLVTRFFNSIESTAVPETDRGRIKMKIVRVCKSLEDCVELMGRTPKAVAAAVMSVVFTELGVGPSRAELCKICDVSAPTLGKIEAIVKAQLKGTGS
jgi:transcription initiation factor TFIIB